MNIVTKRILLWGAVVVVVGLLAWPKLQPDASGTAPPGPRTSGDNRLPVSTFVVQPDRIRDRILITGTILADEEVELRSEASGRVTALSFQEGRRVQAGELLLKINDSELQAQRTQAEYRLRLAEDRERREAQLLEKGGISRESYEATLNEVNVLRSGLLLIDAQLEKTEMRAPFGGIVGLRQVSLGSYITPTTPIATLQDLRAVKVEFSIPERYASRVQVDDEIYFTVEGLEGTFSGRIYAYEPKIEAGTRTLRLRARTANPGSRLVPGAFANIELVFEEIDDALTVPAIAVIPELGGARVFLYQGGTAMPRSVRTGIRLDDRVQVIEGLAVGDTVITTGIQQLRPGLAVRPRSASTDG